MSSISRRPFFFCRVGVLYLLFESFCDLQFYFGHILKESRKSSSISSHGAARICSQVFSIWPFGNANTWSWLFWFSLAFSFWSAQRLIGSKIAFRKCSRGCEALTSRLPKHGIEGRDAWWFCSGWITLIVWNRSFEFGRLSKWQSTQIFCGSY